MTCWSKGLGVNWRSRSQSSPEGRAGDTCDDSVQERREKRRRKGDGYEQEPLRGSHLTRLEPAQ